MNHSSMSRLSRVLLVLGFFLVCVGGGVLSFVWQEQRVADNDQICMALWFNGSEDYIPVAKTRDIMFDRPDLFPLPGPSPLPVSNRTIAMRGCAALFSGFFVMGLGCLLPAKTSFLRE